MPISYSIDHERRFIVETWTGDVAEADLAAYWRRYLDDPEVLAVRRTLVDLRNCRILFRGEQLANLIDRIVRPALDGRDWKTAILVGGPLQFGVSRQYQAFAETYSRDAIFDRQDAALAWLLREDGLC
jgi:hypothetical protein